MKDKRKEKQTIAENGKQEERKQTRKGTRKKGKN